MAAAVSKRGPRSGETVRWFRRLLSCVRGIADEDVMVNVSSRAVGAVLAALLFTACSATGYRIADLASEINSTRDTMRTVVVVGDTIKVSFALRADLNHDVRVRQDGHASFRGLDAVAVAGLNLAELDQRLTELYSKVKIENASDLTVDLAPAAPEATGVSPDALFVVGEVERPGPVSAIGRPLTLFEAIAAAGGHRKATANLCNVILVRRLGSGENRSWRLDCDIYDWGAQPPIYLQPRDIVFVPNTAIDEVDIWFDKHIRQLIPLPPLFPAQ